MFHMREIFVNYRCLYVLATDCVQVSCSTSVCVSHRLCTKKLLHTQMLDVWRGNTEQCTIIAAMRWRSPPPPGNPVQVTKVFRLRQINHSRFKLQTALQPNSFLSAKGYCHSNQKSSVLPCPGRGVALTTHPHILPRLTKDLSYTSAPPPGLCGLS